MNDSELRYPVKYAILELMDENNKIYGFVVSKCYVIEDLTKYLADGSSINYHKVVFPYPNILYYRQKLYYDYQTKDIGVKCTPKYDFFGELYNGHIVDELFDSYDMAYIHATKKNHELGKKLASSVMVFSPNYQEELEKVNLNFSFNMATCEKFEKLIFENTRDMVIVNEKNSPVDSEDLDTHKKMIRMFIKDGKKLKK